MNPSHGLSWEKSGEQEGVFATLFILTGKLSGHTIVVSGYVEKNGTVSGTPFDLILSDSKILATDIPLVTKRILGTSANLIHERTFLENGKVTINTYPQSTGDNNIIGYWIVVLRKV